MAMPIECINMGEYGMHYTHTQNAINNTQFVFIWFLIFSFFINASFWYYLTFSFNAIWFQWSVWKSICLKMFLQLLEMCLFRMRSISEWEKNGKCIILHNRKLMNWIKILDMLFSVKWIKMWIIFHFSFSILLAQCINGISFCSVTNLKPFFLLCSRAKSTLEILFKQMTQFYERFLILFTRCGLFLCQMKSKKNTSKDAIQIWFNLSQSYHPYIPDMYMQLN